MLNVQNIFRFFGVLTMASVFLPGIFAVYLPFPFRISLLYFLLWIPLVMLYNYSLLFNKSLLLVLAFSVIMYLGMGFFWEERLLADDKRMLTNVFFEIMFIYGATLIFLYFLRSGDTKGLKILIYSSFIFITTTTILSLRGLALDPMAVRFAMSGQSDQIETTVRSLGIVGYGFFNGVMLLIPALGYFLNKQGIGITKKAIILFFVAFAIYPMFLGGITTTMLLAVLLFIYSVFFVKRFSYRPFLPFLIIGLFLFVFNAFTAEILLFIADSIGEGIIKEKITELSTTVLLQDYNPEEGRTYFAYSRLALTAKSFWGFLENPLIGTGVSGGHAYWLDRLAEFGLLGWLPILLIFFNQLYLQKNIMRRDHYPYFLVSFFGIFILGVLKANVVSAQTTMVLFFLVPGLFLLEKMNAADNR